MAEKKNLPTLADLTLDKQEAFKHDQFNNLVNQPPPDGWVKVHPFIKGWKYLPIDKVEFLLKRIFKEYKIEVKEVMMMMNSVTSIVRVHYRHPVSGEWLWHDGQASAELQTKKETGPLRADMSNVNPGAVPMAVGTSKSLAVKDACDHIGDLFGANLNRRDVQPFTTDNSLKKHETQRVLKMMDSIDTIEGLEELKAQVPEEFRDLVDSKIDYLKNEGGDNA